MLPTITNTLCLLSLTAAVSLTWHTHLHAPAALSCQLVTVLQLPVVWQLSWAGCRSKPGQMCASRRRTTRPSSSTRSPASSSSHVHRRPRPCRHAVPPSAACCSCRLPRAIKLWSMLLPPCSSCSPCHANGHLGVPVRFAGLHFGLDSSPQQAPSPDHLPVVRRRMQPGSGRWQSRRPS